MKEILLSSHIRFQTVGVPQHRHPSPEEVVCHSEVRGTLDEGGVAVLSVNLELW